MGKPDANEFSAIVSRLVSIVRGTVPSRDTPGRLAAYISEVLKIPEQAAEAAGRIVLQLLARKEPKDTLGDVVRTITAGTTAKPRGETVVYIVVGPKIARYTPDVTFIPSLVYVRAGDKLKWQLSNGGDFEVRFAESPFEGTLKPAFGEDEVGTIAESAPPGKQFHYNLSRLYGKPWPWTAHCPEIIIDK
jgi:hypothetical protein